MLRVRLCSSEANLLPAADASNGLRQVHCIHNE